jgi:hypothetical protein
MAIHHNRPPRRRLRSSRRTEPETILPSLTIDAGAILDFATEYSVAWLRTELYGTATR